MRTLITGGAGFIGSHLCERFLAEGHEVLCVDNLITGYLGNVEHLRGHQNFSYIRHDISHPLEIDGPVDNVLHFASPASPVDYLKHPIPTLKVGSLGTHNMLGLAKLKKSRFLLASTSEVYGDPQIHPQREDYWGHVNPIGVRGCYDESKRFAEAITMAYHRYHAIDTHIVRIFNSVLGDQSVVLFNDDTLHLEPIEEYAKQVQLEPQKPRQVLVPAFNPATNRMEIREASALIKHYAQQDAFELKLRYGRSVKVTGDHSVFVKGTTGCPEPRPVREIRPGDHVAIPALLPVVEKDRPCLNLAEEFIRVAHDSQSLWDWSVQHPSFSQLVEDHRPTIHAFLKATGRFQQTTNLKGTLGCTTRKWIRRGMMPLAVLARLGLQAPAESKIFPYRSTNKAISNGISVSPDLLWLMGFFLAEGSGHYGDGVYFITLASDSQYLRRATVILQDHFQVKVGTTPATPQRAPSIWAHSKTLYHVFDQVLGLRSRRIPPWVLQLPLDRLKHFLEGFRCGDGTHSGKKLGNELVFDSTSEELAVGLNYLLLRFGIVASFGRYETTFRQKYGDRRFPFFRLTVCSLDDFDILHWDKGVRQNLNASRTGDLVWALVKEVRPCVMTGHVYDFSVPGNENFLAGNGVCCHNTFGERMRLDDGRVVPNFIGQALRGEPLTVYGDGSQTRSFCYVSDLVDGIYRLLTTDFHEPVNLGNPDEVTVLQFAQEILELSGSQSPIEFRPLPQDDPRVRRPDIDRARRLLGWQPRVPRRDGLGRTLEYFRTKIAQAKTAPGPENA